MRTKFLMLTALLALTGFAVSAQVLSVASVERLAIPQGEATEQVAAISADGTYLLLTSGAQTGLVKWDIATGRSTVLTTAPAAGFEPTLSADGTSVTYREISVGGDRLVRTSVKRADLVSGRTSTLQSPTRDMLAVATQLADRTVQQGPAKGQYRVAGASRPQVLNDQLRLKLKVDGTLRDFAPNGSDLNYIWASVSPDGSKVLYFCSDLGCAYVCPVGGGLPQELGNIHAAQWIDDYTIVAMEDEDNGEVTTSSRIVAVTLDGRRQVLTEGSQIAMWPHASADGSKIVYSTPEGAAYLINVNR